MPTSYCCRRQMRWAAAQNRQTVAFLRFAGGATTASEQHVKWRLCKGPNDSIERHNGSSSELAGHMPQGILGIGTKAQKEAM